MSRRPAVVVLTSNERRHRYAVQSLAESLEIRGVLAEEKAVPGGAAVPPAPADAATLRTHFAARDAAEARLLGDVSFPDGVELRSVPNGGSNSSDVFDWVTSKAPDLVLLYGTSIIRPPLLDHFDGRMVNIHLGLSPYYRGAGTNFWPLVDRRPECVGATIHLAILKVDAGAVLTQVRPVIAEGDGAHEIGTKTIIEGLEAMKRALPRYLSGELEPVAQDLGVGTVYRRSHFNADAVRRMWRNFETGMVAEYLASMDERQRAFPIADRV